MRFLEKEPVMFLSCLTPGATTNNQQTNILLRKFNIYAIFWPSEYIIKKLNFNYNSMHTEFSNPS